MFDWFGKKVLDFSCQIEIKIRWKILSIGVKSEPISFRWCLFAPTRRLEDRRSFVHFIEHGNHYGDCS